MPAAPFPPGPLTLDLEYRSATHWRWVLSDPAGRFVADHEVALDPTQPEYDGFVDLPAYLQHLEPTRDADALLAGLGDWLADRVFGAVGTALLRARPNPACVVRVRVPAAAQELLFRPFELTRIGGRTLAERGVRLVYTVGEGGDAAVVLPVAAPATDPLRVLAVFSLPDGATPLGLRQERVALEQFIHTFADTHGRAVQLRVLQYGATRAELAEALGEYPGWDVLHFSGHGLAGELVLEGADGTPDRIGGDELVELLQLTQGRLRLLVLSACYSGAADLAGARAALGLDAPLESAALDGDGDARRATTMLPSLGQRLAQELDCAVVAMRYPVLDQFAADLALELYEGLLERGQPLPAALQQALARTLDPAAQLADAGLSRITPLLFGERAGTLRLVPPPRSPAQDGGFALAETGLFEFPEPPTHFVGRLGPMLRARRVLAPRSGQTTIIFHGMAGAGKTACALELAHRYAPRYTARFQGFVWYQAPQEGAAVEGALATFAAALERQLPGLQLVGLVDDPTAFRVQALPRLRALMRERAILLVLDNVEGLQTADGGWRDARWGELLTALTDHSGIGCTVLTTRRLPTALAASPRVLVEPIHALSLAESVVLAREMPHLGALFRPEAGPSGRATLRRLLGAAEGHPKLLELADGLAADPAQLAAHLARVDPSAPADGGAAEAPTSRFFTSGESDRAADAFVRALHTWTVTAVAGLPTTARLLAHTLARLEGPDRTSETLQDNWRDVLDRLTGTRGGEPALPPAREWAARALAEDGLGLDGALDALARTALAEVVRTTSEEAPDPTEDDLRALVTEGAEHSPPLAAALAALARTTDDGTRAQLEAELQGMLAPLVRDWRLARRRTVVRWVARVHPGVAEALCEAAPPAVLAAIDTEAADYFLSAMRHGLRGEVTGGGPLVVGGARHAIPYLIRSGRHDEASLGIEQMLLRDQAPATLAFALPALRHIADSARGTAFELQSAAALAAGLVVAQRYTEAEAALRDVIALSIAQANYRVASPMAGRLFNLLRQTGRFEEALALTAEMAEYTRRAGLGPWTQLSDMGQRLQALSALGRREEVLAEVQRLRPVMAALPENGDLEEATFPHMVREGMLGIGRSAALQAERWAEGLSLNAELQQSMRRRGASAFELARTRFNDYSALVSLGQLAACRALLDECRQVFEEAGYLIGVGNVYTALASLEAAQGRHARAADFARSALRYDYQSGQPIECAIDHSNLANYLGKSGGAPVVVLAHRLADALICLQTGEGTMATSLRNLTLMALPDQPPAFDALVRVVEQEGGVRFAALFAALPTRHPSGDAALGALWEMLRTHAAPVPEQEGVAELIEALTTATGGDVQARAAVESALPDLEAKGWHLSDAVHRLWSGERDAAALTAGLDAQDTAIVRRVLDRLG